MTLSQKAASKTVLATAVDASLNPARLGSARRCGQYKGFASAQVDGQLTPQEAVQYQQHREVCATCCADLVELQQVSLMLKRALRTNALPQLRQEVMAMIAFAGIRD